MNLNLTPEQCNVLRETLRDALTHLEVEINRTDNLSFKEGLREKERILTSLVEAMEARTIVK